MVNNDLINIKICFIIDSLDLGGANILTADLVNILAENGKDVSLITLRNTNNRILNLHNKVKLIETDIFSHKFLKRLIILYKLLRQFHIVHSTLEQSNFYSSLVTIFLPSITLICSVHGKEGVFIEDEELQNELKKSVFRKYIIIVKYFQQLLNRRFNKFISLSIDTMDYLTNIRKIPVEKIKQIYYGYDFNKLGNKIMPEEAIRLKEKYGYAKEDFIVLYIGRITFAKGLELLLESMPFLIKKYSNLKLLLVGDGEIKERLEILISEMGFGNKIQFAGLDYDVKKFYCMSDLFILPSNSECIPLSVEEAMFLGTIVLTSNAGGLPEIVKDNFNGFVFEKGSSKSLIEKIVYIIENKHSIDRIRKNAKEFVLDKFNLRKNYLDIMKLFNETALKR